MITIHGCHASGEDQAEAAMVPGGVREPGTSTGAAHRPIDDAPRRWVCLPALETPAVENPYASRIRRRLILPVVVTSMGTEYRARRQNKRDSPCRSPQILHDSISASYMALDFDETAARP